jgi:hypothetical protein
VNPELPEPPEIVRCPRCGGRDIRQSYPKPLLDSIMTMFQMKPLRCRFCRCRFYKRLLPGDAGLRLPTEAGPDREN